MSTTSLAAELALYGPGTSAVRPSLAEAEAYCRRLARTHYENFTVASWLLPRDLRPHFYHVYAYCRWADDLADEAQDPAESLALLDWWSGQLGDCYEGRARHPVFVALEGTIKQFSIPPEPLLNLLVAFRQDQSVHRYETFVDLLGYCRNSADPVGRLVLCLGRCHTPENVRLSDSVCTGLQLANFCQDVARDYSRGRIYLPQETLRASGYTTAMFQGRQYNSAFRRAMAAEVERAAEWLRAGRPLVDRVPRELKLDVALFIEGGLSILESIRRIDYNVWATRPTVSRARKLRLMASAWLRAKRGMARGAQA